MSFKTQSNVRLNFSWLVLGLMSSVTFVGMLSELMPSGVLPQMAEGLGVSESQIGFLVGVYALASALCAIPLISATLAVNRKKLLMVLLTGFAISNIIVAVSSSYYVLVASRILGGMCAGVMWPMIAAYGTRLVPENMEGKAITIIMAGTTFGISLGLPAMTTISLTFGWHTGFLILGAVVALIAVLSYFILPSIDGERLSKSNSPFAVLKLPSMLIILLLTFLSVIAHYGIYTYITLLVELIDFIGGIGLALLIFGIGSVLSVVVTAKFIDAHLRALIVFMLAIGGLSMTLLLMFGGAAGTSHIAFFLWGVAFGPVVTMYQTAVTKQVKDGVAVATSVQSSIFNFSIMISTWIGGLLLTRFPETGVIAIVYVSLTAFALATVIAFFAKRTLRAS